MRIDLQRNYTKDMDNTVHVLIGCGLTGSNVFSLLVRSGATRFILVDHDTVEERNLYGQVFNKDDVGESKVQALSDWAVMNGYIEYDRFIKTHQEEFVLGQLPENLPGASLEIQRAALNGRDIVIYSMVDSMKARKDILGLYRNLFPIMTSYTPPTLVESRIGSTSYQLYILRSWKHLDAYESTIYSDEEAKEVPACQEGYNLGVVMECVSKIVHSVTLPVERVMEYDHTVQAYELEKEDLNNLEVE